MKEMLGNLFRRPFTQDYPKKKTEPFDRFRGKLVYHPNKCIGCRLCSKICPSRAITFHEKGKIDFDLKTCMQCGMCVDACPTKAITWDKTFETASKDKASLVVK